MVVSVGASTFGPAVLGFVGTAALLSCGFAWGISKIGPSGAGFDGEPETGVRRETVPLAVELGAPLCCGAPHFVKAGLAVLSGTL